MKKILFSACLMALTLTYANAESPKPKATKPAVTGVQVKEKLNRAPVAVKTSQGILVSWRSLSTDGKASFDVVRNGETIASKISDRTNYLDKEGKPGNVYKVVSSNGDEAVCVAWQSICTGFDVKRPDFALSYMKNDTCCYYPDDMSVGDLDGDGEYEIVCKWMPEHAADNGSKGYTAPCVFSAFKMNGKQMWSKFINLGYSIRTGAHYSPFLVYDLDGDGKAEFLCKTGPDSRDGNGNLVTKKGDATIQAVPEDHFTVSTAGHVKTGEEFLTVFNGATGEAMQTIWYSPGRDGSDFPMADTNLDNKFWGDSYGNRGYRFNACVAYLDGYSKLPTAIFQRGYYQACYLWAVDWNGKQLKTRWLHRGTSKTTWSTVDSTGKVLFDEIKNPVKSQGKSSYGMGVHSISVGDMNNDGFDEITIGSATIAHDGSLMCSTGFGHGDAIHLTDLIPSRPGLEVMMPHEDRTEFGNYGYDVHDATTGEVIVHGEANGDTGRGMAGNFIPRQKNSVYFTSAQRYSYDCETGDSVSPTRADMCFRIYWTGDPYDQTFEGKFSTSSKGYSPRINAFNSDGTKVNLVCRLGDYEHPRACNYTKANPCLQADILGDWREEVILYQSNKDRFAPTTKILIYSTPEPTEYKVPCLMEDHVYRMGIVWQNCSYNQPPHLGYNLANYLKVDGSTYQMQNKFHAPRVAR